MYLCVKFNTLFAKLMFKIMAGTVYVLIKLELYIHPYASVLHRVYTGCHGE